MLSPARIAALSALVASDACQRATPVPLERLHATRAAWEAAAGFVADDVSVDAQRRLLAWLRGRSKRR